jgi:glycosyltransferase involved in cell wall biosynthesis
MVHTHLIHADLYGLPAAQRAGVPHAISSRHNDDAFRRQPLIRWLNRRAMDRADRVIAISEAVGRFVRQVEGIDAAKVVTVHYGLEPPEIAADARESGRARLDIAADVPLIGAFGRLVAQKGFDVLLDAVAQVHQTHPAARFVIVGDGSLRADLEAQAAALELGEVVTFAGWVDNARTLMPACDVISVPSRWEGFGLVTLEAMGYSVPLVASRASALPEIILDGETGLLVPPEDAAALAGAFDQLLGDPARAERLGKAGRDRLHNTFSVERMVDATLDVYRQVMG